MLWLQNFDMFRRECTNSPLCSISKVKEETVEHASFLCPYAECCWFGSPLQLNFDEMNMIRMGR